MKYWIVKSEPEEYSLADLARQKRCVWDGVRNYQARNFMKEMQLDDLVFFYESGKHRAIVGLAKVVRTAYPDPTAPDFILVDLAYVSKCSRPVTLTEIKSHPEFKELKLVKQSRLSVMPISEKDFDLIKRMGG